MKTRPWGSWLWACIAAIAALSAAVTVTGPTPKHEPYGIAAARGEGGLPPALARHMERLRRAIPGNLGESAEGPGAASDEAFLNLAYPDTDIPLARLTAARSASQNVKSRNFPKGKGRPDAWVSVGPSNALYQFTPLRTSDSYVPNEYAAGGRTTALALAGDCVPGHCRLYAAPAGGGLWRVDNALNGQPSWSYVSAPFGINSVSSIAVDPNDASGNTVWVGTGEANASGDSAAGVGIYKTTDGGVNWTGPLGSSVFNARAVGTIAAVPGSPGTLYAGTTRGVLGVSSVTGGAVSLIPGAARWGLYKSSDGGVTWSFIHNGSTNPAACLGNTTEASNGTACSPRGVRRVVVDPSDPSTVYAGSYARGVWRSNDAGATWTQIKASLESSNTATRPEIAVAALPNGKTRLYVGEGGGSLYSRLFRSDDVATGAPAFTDLSSSSYALPGRGSYNYCTGQCWYDNFVYSPPGYPDMVYLLGSYQYGETGLVSNGRAVVLSTDAGMSWSDMTMDATDAVHPNGIHPDAHAIVTNPNNPFQFFQSSDGGIVRSSGELADTSARCDGFGLPGEPYLGSCKQLLSRVPTEITSMNKGFVTLQFQSLSVSPHNANLVQGGTQDNGTWQSTGNPNKWLQTMWGDGGQSGFDVADPQFRFHTYFNATPDVNFSGGEIADWNWIGDPIFGTEPQAFYVPIISDPKTSGTLFVGTSHVWRTKTFGMGSMDLATFRQHCNEFFGDFSVTCGDWQPLGNPGTAGRLTSSSYGDRAGGTMAAVERTASDAFTMWAATSTGRVFVSTNADADPASAVVFSRIDTLSSADPNRFVSGISIDPANPNHAWISYTGFSASTPTTPGHVFEVTWNGSSASWVDRSYDLGDIPITDVVRDDATGDLYAASDFGVFRLAAGATSWTLAAPGMPSVEVAGLTMAPTARKLYAATHGLGAWLLNLK